MMNIWSAHLHYVNSVPGQVAHSACGRYPGPPGPLGKHAEMHVIPGLLLKLSFVFLALI